MSERTIQERLRETAPYFAERLMTHNARNMLEAADRIDELEKALRNIADIQLTASASLEYTRCREIARSALTQHNSQEGE